MPQDYREFVRGQDPEYEVLVEEAWQPAFVRAWTRRNDGSLTRPVRLVTVSLR